MFTADEYRIAAKVCAEEFGQTVAVSALVERAERVSRQEAFCRRLGLAGSSEADAVARGKRLIIFLKDEGWIPPESLPV